MKRIATLIIVLFLVGSCKAQILLPQGVIPIEDINTYQGDVPDGGYIKDVHHLLDKYEGTWVGSFDNKTYKIVINKVVDSYLEIQEDKLLLRYKITDENGNVIANTINLPDENRLIVEGYRMVDGDTNNEYYKLLYHGEECAQNGIIYISINNNTNQMNLGLSVPGGGFSCEDYGSVQQVLPTFKTSGGVMLIKQ